VFECRKSPFLFLSGKAGSQYWNETFCVFRARTVYVGGLLFYSVGMFLMAVTQHSFGVILFSWAAGVMYSTLFTMPYLLVALYHDRGMVNNSCF